MRDRKPPTQSEVIFTDRFWRNRRGEALCVEIKKLDGDAHVIDIRQWFTSREGQLRPTTQGVCLSIRKLPEVKRAVDKAMSAAEALGLLPPEEKS